MSNRAVMLMLGYAGLLPFYGFLLGIWLLQDWPAAVSVQGFVVYSLAILSFLGGTLWGRVQSLDKPMADIAVLDAELTLGLPAHVTAMTGIDAMVHAIEAYTSKIKKNPVSDMLARQALTLLSANQRRVLSHPDDVAAREAMLLGATLAGQAFANAPVAAVHALAYPLGGHYHMPHGLSNALMLPAVLRFNASAAEALYLELAPLLPEPVAPGLEGFVSWFEDLIADAALPTTLSAADVPECDLPMLAADAMLQQRLLVNNPVEVDEAAALALYTAAWSGSA